MTSGRSVEIWSFIEEAHVGDSDIHGLGAKHCNGPTLIRAQGLNYFDCDSYPKRVNCALPQLTIWFNIRKTKVMGEGNLLFHYVIFTSHHISKYGDGFIRMGGYLTTGKGSLWGQWSKSGAGEARKAIREASGREAEAESLLGSQEHFCVFKTYWLATLGGTLEGRARIWLFYADALPPCTYTPLDPSSSSEQQKVDEKVPLQPLPPTPKSHML